MAEGSAMLMARDRLARLESFQDLSKVNRRWWLLGKVGTKVKSIHLIAAEEHIECQLQYSCFFYEPRKSRSPEP